MEDYQPINKIGQGSYGDVWLSRHRIDKKKYVLKQINIQKASRRQRDAANLEAKLLATLKHPNIVSYRDSFVTDDGFLYIAMGFCEGGDLYTRIKDRRGVPFEETQVVQWSIQICMAVQYLHERNILHRDLKTQNIFLTKGKLVKVGDLGIAKVLGSATDMATTLIGTPYYMSPELFSNKPYNYKSDIWALGCCIYEMATLRHAFNARDINALVSKILLGKLPVMPRNYSVELRDMIRSLLHHDPDKRPCVSKVLRSPFVKRNIEIFLNNTKSKRENVNAAEEDGQLRLVGHGVRRNQLNKEEDEKVQSECTKDQRDRSPGSSGESEKLLMVNGREMKLEERKISGKFCELSPRTKREIGNGENGPRSCSGTLSPLPPLSDAVLCRGDEPKSAFDVKRFESKITRPNSCSSNCARDRRRRKLVADILENPVTVAKPRPLPLLPVLPVIPRDSSSDRDRPSSAQSVDTAINPEGQLNLCARQRRRQRLRGNLPVIGANIPGVAPKLVSNGS